MAQIRQSGPDSGLGFQVKFLKPFWKLVPLRSEEEAGEEGSKSRHHQSVAKLGKQVIKVFGFEPFFYKFSMDLIFHTFLGTRGHIEI